MLETVVSSLLGGYFFCRGASAFDQDDDTEVVIACAVLGTIMFGVALGVVQ